MFCDKRLNCKSQPLKEKELAALDKRIATADGHANRRLWCMAHRRYSGTLQKCILDGDLLGYATEMFAIQEIENKKTNNDLLEADAAYCFGAGLCNDTEVTPTTSFREAEGICDRRFGHERWTGVGWSSLRQLVKDAREMPSAEDQSQVPPDMNFSTPTPPPAGSRQALELQRLRAELSALISCAMGSFHCDVAYCRDNYCVDEGYRTKYGNLTWLG